MRRIGSGDGWWRISAFDAVIARNADTMIILGLGGIIIDAEM